MLAINSLQFDRYLKERKQFGAPLAAFQLNQEKLVRMLGNIQAMLLVGWRLCKLYESGKMTTGHASLGKVLVFYNISRQLLTCLDNISLYVCLSVEIKKCMCAQGRTQMEPGRALDLEFLWIFIGPDQIRISSLNYD